MRRVLPRAATEAYVRRLLLGLSSACLLSAAFCASDSMSGSTWFDQQSILSTVVLEGRAPDLSFFPVGTGFAMYKYPAGKGLCIVTCKHVLHWFTNRGFDELWVAFTADSALLEANIGDQPIGRTSRGGGLLLSGGRVMACCPLKKDTTYMVDPVHDVAVMPLAAISDRTARWSARAVPQSLVKFARDIDYGTDVYFVGFPGRFGRGSAPLRPLLRTGIVASPAWDSTTFIVDGVSWGGNSGSPVFAKRDPARFGGLGPYLLGMVTGHLPESTPVEETVESTAVKIPIGRFTGRPTDTLVVIVPQHSTPVEETVVSTTVKIPIGRFTGRPTDTLAVTVPQRKSKAAVELNSVLAMCTTMDVILPLVLRAESLLK